MRLTRKQRAAFFAGDCPSISGEGECPVAPGDVIRLSSKVTFTVVRVKRKVKGKWRLSYVVHDKRDPVRNLRRTPADTPDYDAIREAYAPENFKWDELPVVRERRNVDPAEDSAYTGRGIGLVEDAGEAPPPEFIASILDGTYAERQRKRKKALEKARQAARELRELIDAPGGTGRERKHLKEIEHHIRQLESFVKAA